MIINKLGALLKERGLSKTALAVRIGRKRAQVSWWCRPTTAVTSHTLNLLCGALHVQPEDLLDFVPDELTTPQQRKENIV